MAGNDTLQAQTQVGITNSPSPKSPHVRHRPRNNSYIGEKVVIVATPNGPSEPEPVEPPTPSTPILNEEEFPRTCSHLPAQVLGYQYFLLIPHWDTITLVHALEKGEATSPSIKPRLLMFHDDNDKKNPWHLPLITLEKQPYYRVPAIIKEAEERWNLKIRLTLNLEESYDPETDHVQIIYQADVEWKDTNPDQLQLPPGSEWVDSSILKQDTKFQNIKWAASQWFDEIEHNAFPEHRVPWAFPGWSEETREWILDQLKQRGYEIQSEIEQIDLSCLSFILRVKTDRGHIYFKASAPGALPHEGPLTAYLSDNFPGKVTSVLLYDKKHGVLMEEFKGKHLGSIEYFDVWAQAIVGYAQLQLSCIEKRDEMLALGCPDRRVSHLLEGWKEMLEDRVVFKYSNLALDDQQIDKLKTLVPSLEKLAAEIESYKVPNTLDHGDLYPSNIIVLPDGDPLIFDWAEASITHPFFSMLPVFRDLHDSLRPRQDELLDIYLKQWTQFEPMERLHEVWNKALYLGMLLQAVKFWEIINKIEPECRHYDQPSIPLWARFLLRRFRFPDQDVFAQE